MKKLLKAKIWRIPLIVLVVLTMVLVGGGAALAVTVTNYSSDIPVTGNCISTWSLAVQTDGSAIGNTAVDNTGGSPYASGTSVSISATAGVGYIFSYWELVSGSGTFANANAASTTFTTGAATTVVKAHFSILVDIPLYTDLACTVLFSGSLNLGTVNIVDGQPVTVTTVLYFKANKSRLVPGGYGSGDVNPYTVQTTDNCADGNISRTYLVGEPIGAMAWHPCVYTISITVNSGASSPISFTIHVTGSSDLVPN